ncbi:hypothetical protein C5167_029377 [Papaver somniferum]|nr:hypothetical protein C5167_029372 [Papaver somniferum]RZC93734.1 hypothetical protein C5167_029377 [Papaver somniferum]
MDVLRPDMTQKYEEEGPTLTEHDAPKVQRKKSKDERQRGVVCVNHVNDVNGLAFVEDIHMESFSVSIRGRELIQDGPVTLSFGRHYGRLGRNGTRSHFLFSLRYMSMHAIDGIPKKTWSKKFFRDFEFKTAAEKKTAEEMNKVDVSQKLDQVRIAVFSQHQVDWLDLTSNPLLYMMSPNWDLTWVLWVYGNLTLQPIYYQWRPIHKWGFARLIVASGHGFGML